MAHPSAATLTRCRFQPATAASAPAAAATQPGIAVASAAVLAPLDPAATAIDEQGDGKTKRATA